MSQHVKSKQTLVTSAIKLALDNFKNTRQHQGRAVEGSQLYCYTWKGFLLAERNDKIEKKKGLK